MTMARDGSQDLRPVGKKKSVADIEENCAPFGHEPILLKAAVEAERTCFCALGLKRFVRWMPLQLILRDPRGENNCNANHSEYNPLLLFRCGLWLFLQHRG